MRNENLKHLSDKELRAELEARQKARGPVPKHLVAYEWGRVADLVIPNNENSSFNYPNTEYERQRGFYD